MSMCSHCWVRMDYDTHLSVKMCQKQLVCIWTFHCTRRTYPGGRVASMVQCRPADSNDPGDTAPPARQQRTLQEFPRRHLSKEASLIRRAPAAASATLPPLTSFSNVAQLLDSFSTARLAAGLRIQGQGS